MRPIELEISAFGPFGDRVTIPFEDLGNSGLYLISGDTGAGKTTIFDAISYALFDVSSGRNREKTMFRSLYAKENQKTYVKLKFQYKGRLYEILRNPSYLRPSKRGQSMTMENANAFLTFPDKTTISGLSQVNTEVEKILGINEDQFRQIVMIAQGDFLRLLHADSQSKRDLFRKIFSTQNFGILEDRIKDLQKDVKNQYEQVKANFISIANNVNLEKENVFFTEINSRPEEAKRILNAHIKDLESKRSDYKKDLEGLNDSHLQIEKKIDLIENQEKLQTQIKEENKNLERLEQEKICLNKDYEKLSDYKQDLDKLKLEKGRLEDQKLEFDEYDKLIKNQDKIQKEKLSLDKEFSSLKTSLDKDILSKEKSENFIEVNKDNEKLLAQARIELNNSKSKEAVVKKAIDIYKRISILSEEIETNSNALIEKQAKVFELTESLKNKEDLYFLNQAGILASKLREGQECPVCGSTHHPNKAHLKDDSVSKDELEQTKLSLGTAREDRDRTSNQLNNLRNQKAQFEENLGDNFLELGFNEQKGLSLEELEGLKKEIESKINSSKTEITNFEKIGQEIDNIQEELAKLRTSILDKENNRAEISNKLASLSTSLKTNQSFINKKAEGLKYASLDDLKEKEDEISLKIKESEAFIDNIVKDVNDNEANIKTSQALLKNLKSNLVNVDFDELEVLNAEIIRIEQSKQDINDQLDDVIGILRVNKAQEKALDRAIKDFDKIDKRYAEINDLYQTITGQIAGKDSVKFEVFAQMTYFEEIINRANIRFMEITNGQFALRRKTEASKKNIQSGLEIELVDQYSMKTRDVKTLSGGESFKAALALALGLSDTVQMYSGAVEFNSIFVDEGFGTLDKESLNQVMQILNKISSNNKLVGIISHVDTLKESIDKQILVKKDKDMTSHIEMKV